MRLDGTVALVVVLWVYWQRQHRISRAWGSRELISRALSWHELVVWVFGSAEHNLRERDQHG
jgi:hypothetical protein